MGVLRSHRAAFRCVVTGMPAARRLRDRSQHRHRAPGSWSLAPTIRLSTPDERIRERSKQIRNRALTTALIDLDAVNARQSAGHRRPGSQEYDMLRDNTNRRPEAGVRAAHLPSRRGRHRHGRDPAGAALAACGGDDDPESAPPKGDPNAPANLTFWTWTTNIEKVVDIWNEKNPTQKVTVSRPGPGRGADHQGRSRRTGPATHPT